MSTTASRRKKTAAAAEEETMCVRGEIPRSRATIGGDGGSGGGDNDVYEIPRLRETNRRDRIGARD
jgi:hypothetical protein